MSARRDCAVLFTHWWSLRLARHVEKLKREAGRVLDVFVVLQSDAPDLVPTGMGPDLVVGFDDAERHFPQRSRNLRASWNQHWGGYVDTMWLSAFLHPKLADYDRFWLVEYDVDYSGDWSRFFAEAADYPEDLLITRVRRLSDDPGWSHAPALRMPIATDPLFGLFCISRLSRAVVETYRDAMLDPTWSGHFEALIPTVAEAAGFRIGEIGGTGAFTPPERSNRHYAGTFQSASSVQTTWSFRPPKRYSYFAEKRPGTGKRDTLYHPIKLDVPIRQRLRYMEQDLRWGIRDRRRLFASKPKG